MNDKIFWAIIDKMNWTKDYNYKRISKEVKNQIYGDKERMMWFLETYNKKIDTLTNIAHQMNPKEYQKYINKTDEELWETISYIIGLGKKHYNAIIKKHSKFKKYKKNKSIENFSYSFEIIYRMKEL